MFLTWSKHDPCIVSKIRQCMDMSPGLILLQLETFGLLSRLKVKLSQIWYQHGLNLILVLPQKLAWCKKYTLHGLGPWTELTQF